LKFVDVLISLPIAPKPLPSICLNKANSDKFLHQEVLLQLLLTQLKRYLNLADSDDSKTGPCTSSHLIRNDISKRDNSL